MTTTVAIEYQRGRKVRFRYTRTETGAQWVSGLYRLPEGTDPLTFAASIADRQEVGRRKAERDTWWELFIAGVDLDTLTPQFSSRNNLRRRVLRRLVNMMRAANKEVPREAKATIAANVLPYLSKFTNNQIATVINRDPPWDAAKVGDVRTRLENLANSLDGLDHGEDEII